MKTGKNITAFSIIILLTIGITVFGQDNLISKTKTVEKVFSNNIKIMDVNNSFGDIDISYWDENKLKATVVINVEATDEETAKNFIEKLLPKISSECDSNNICDFSLRPQYFYTNNKNHGKIFSPWSKKNTGIKQFSIDFELKIPRSVDYISVSNSYGNISIPDFSGTMILSLTNGDLKAGKLLLDDSSSRLEIRYSKVNIKSIENSNSVYIYSCNDVKIGEVKNIMLFSKFSDIQIDNCSDLSIDSKSDNITIDNLESFNGTGAFTNININNLKKTINFKDKSGTIKLDRIYPGFENISLTGQFNDYILFLNELNCVLNVDFEYTDLECPEYIFPANKRESLINGEAAFKKNIGDETTESQITLKCSNCNVELK